MSGDGFGIEVHGRHAGRTALKRPARYLVLIVDATGQTAARLFDAERRPVGDFDAGAEEVAVMTHGLVPEDGALDAAWEAPLRGHSDAERRGARVFTLDI